MLTDGQLIIAFLFRHSKTFPGGILSLEHFSNHFHKMLRFAIPNWKQIQNNPKVSCNHFLNCFSKSDLLSRYLPPLPQPHNLRRWRKQGDVKYDDDDVSKEVMVNQTFCTDEPSWPDGRVPRHTFDAKYSRGHWKVIIRPFTASITNAVIVVVVAIITITMCWHSFRILSCHWPPCTGTDEEWSTMTRASTPSTSLTTATSSPPASAASMLLS